MIKIKQEKRYRRHKRVRAKIFGTVARPRLCVSRSAKHIYAQLIDDKKGKTLAAASDLDYHPPATLQPKPSRPKKEKGKKLKVAIAFEVGKLIAQKALKKKIERAVFDRGGYKYHGRVRALAEGAREGGLKF